MGSPPNLQIPDIIIRNPNINDIEFCIFAVIKHLLFLQKINSNIDITTGEIMSSVGIKDNRTLKKGLLKLHNQEIINEQVNELPRNGILKLTLQSSIIGAKPFTQMPSSIIKHINKIGSVGCRLLYYYESFMSVGGYYSFPSQIRTEEETGLSRKTIIKYTELLEEQGYLYVNRQQGFKERGYVDDRLTFTRLNNQYHVLKERITHV